MLIVADTSALVALATCDALELLDRLFAEVSVPPAVFRECTVEGKAEADKLRRYLESKVVDVNLSDYIILAAGLDRGEAEAMALYRKLRAGALLLDDNRARKVARLNNFNIIGSVGVLLLAKAQGQLSRVKPLLELLRASDIYLSEGLLKEALKLAGEV